MVGDGLVIILALKVIEAAAPVFEGPAQLHFACVQQFSVRLLAHVRGSHDALVAEKIRSLPAMPLLVCPEPFRFKAETSANSKAAHQIG